MANQCGSWWSASATWAPRHAKAYHKLPGFEICGLMSRTIRRSREDLPAELAAAIRVSRTSSRRCARPAPMRSRSTPGPTPMPTTRSARWTPAATCSWRSRSRPPSRTPRPWSPRPGQTNRKLVLGYILRHHPSWAKFVEVGRTLGKPLVMRMNLNQQSSGPAWNWHKNLMESLTPHRRLRRALRRHHVPDDPRQAGARARHRRAAQRRDQGPELRPPARRVRRRLGRLVRGRLGADDERGRLFREGRRRAQGLRLDRRAAGGPDRGQARTDLGFRRHRPAHQDQRAQGPPRRHRRRTTISRARTSGSTWPTSPITRSSATASRRSS